MSLKTAFLPALCVVSALACSNQPSVGELAGHPVSTGSAQQAIYGGSETSDYPFVLGMLAAVDGAFGVCTATLIAPNLVLTARHCLSDTNSEYIECGRTRFTSNSSASQLFVTTDPQMRDQQGNWYGVRKVLLPTINDICGHDIALMILDRSIPSSVATPAEPMVHGSVELTDNALSRITAIGYGTTNGRSGEGRRRIRQNIPLICAFGHPSGGGAECNNYQELRDEGFVTRNDIMVDEGLCQGDSGSSAFEQAAFDANKYYSVGVLSRGLADGCDYGVYTRVDAEKDLIINAALEAAELGGYQPPRWVEGPNLPPRPVEEEEKLEFGESCSAAEQCESGICLGYTDESAICTTACTDASECPEGYGCESDHCVVSANEGEEDEGTTKKTPKQGGTTTTTTTGCAVSTDPTKPIPWRSGSAALTLGAMLLLRRRRR